MYLISLWLPSICQSARGEWTLYRRLLTASLQRCITPVGSVLKNDCLILSLCTRCPLLCSKPLAILIPIEGWDCCADLKKSSSSSSLKGLNRPIIEKIIFRSFEIVNVRLYTHYLWRWGVGHCWNWLMHKWKMTKKGSIPTGKKKIW